MENIGRICDWIEAGRPVPDDRLKKTLSYKDDNIGKQKGANSAKGTTGANALQGVSTSKGASAAGKGGKGAATSSNEKNGNRFQNNVAQTSKGGKSTATEGQLNIQDFLTRLLEEFRSQPY